MATINHRWSHADSDLKINKLQKFEHSKNSLNQSFAKVNFGGELGD